MVNNPRLKGMWENKCTTDCLRRETYATLLPPISIMRLAQCVKVQGSFRHVSPAEILVASKKC